eukprot:scaffold3653_cov124-Cylindrotheca_fusiformis.AAC.8
MESFQKYWTTTMRTERLLSSTNKISQQQSKQKEKEMMVSRLSRRLAKEEETVAPVYSMEEEEKDQGGGGVDSGNYPQIYSAPTVDTLDTLQHTYSSSNSHHPHQLNQNQNQQQQKVKMAATSTNQKLEKDFQFPEDCMSVSVRQIHTAQRSAFARKKPPSYYDHPALSDRNNKRISPSYQQLTLIHKMQNIAYTRQLAFAPSVGRAADVLAPDSILAASTSLKKRDGRYRSIDPVQATIQTLPHSPPLLSNKKHRLPWRADVGFPKASMEEIQRKQQEIAHETEWEEASPRLIVLVTSDDLGTAVQPEYNNHNEKADPPFFYEGPELRYAKECNQRHFRNNKNTADVNTASNNNDNNSKKRTARPPSDSHLRYSVLAPPLDATFSRTLGWRPRPFHDRPPGMHYSLVCPLSIQFDVGNIEPLVCSLTLYSFQEGGLADGKASEDFWFPAGDWNGRISIDSLLPKNGTGDDVMAAFLQRKHKAIFGHDPLVMPTKDAHVVLQVYKVSHVELAAAYLNTTANGSSTTATSTSDSSKNKTSSTNVGHNKFNLQDKNEAKQKLQKHGKKDEAAKTAFRANSVMNSFGTQFMSPLCFGVTPLYPTLLADDDDADDEEDGPSKLEWPSGKIHSNMRLYSYPAQLESQTDFVRRLRKIAARQEESESKTDDSSSPMFFSLMEETSIMSATDSSASTKKKRGGVGRLFSKSSSKKDIPKGVTVGGSSITTATSSGSATTEEGTPLEAVADTPMIAAKVALFVSALDVDFLQAMLYTPPALAEQPVGRKVLPNVLVDASGEAAVMVDPKNATNLVPGHVKKRSDLVRLPCRDGYVDASDFREVLFLPPRPPKNYDVDIPPSFRSLFNLLYLYPKLLRQDGAVPMSKKASKQRYTVRIRLIETRTEEASGTIASTNVSLDAFHNPAPWTGPSMLKSVYTRIPGDDVKQDIQTTGIPMRDEFKLRLPLVLNDNFFLHFSLFAVDLEDELLENVSSGDNDDNCGISTRPVAEATIPLASSSTRDPKTGMKAMIVIPNARHRLKLGSFQLQVESRMISSVHVSDPLVGAALRDFPFVDDDDVQNQDLAIDQGVSQSSSIDTVDKLPFSGVFCAASGSTLAGHFQPLLLMHLSNLVNLRNNKSVSPSEQMLMETVHSLLQVCTRIKTALSVSQADCGSDRFLAFMKSAVDLFDESCLHSSSTLPQVGEEDSGEEGQVDRSRSTPSVSTIATQDDIEDEDKFDGGAVRKRKNALGELEIRITRTFSARETAESPFSRVAYGASKTDRMRLEAELDNRTQYVDDDETVATVETRMTEAREMFELTKKKMSIPKTKGQGTRSPDRKDSSGSGGGESSNANDFSSYARSLGELGIAQRARSAAQIMLAPCVAAAPVNLQSNIASLFTERISPHFTNGGAESQAGIESQRSAMKLESGNEDDELVVSGYSTSYMYSALSSSYMSPPIKFCRIVFSTALGPILRMTNFRVLERQFRIRDLPTILAKEPFDPPGIAKFFIFL